MSQTNLTSLNKFKVGDKVRFKPRSIYAKPQLDTKAVYTIKYVDYAGLLNFYGVYEGGWFPENFELCKNSIVKDIIKDL